MRANWSTIIVLLVGWAISSPSDAQQFHVIGPPSPQQWLVNPSNCAVLDAPIAARCEPLFGLELGAIWLARSEPASQDLILNEDGDVLLNASELNSDLQSGFRATIDFFNITDAMPGLDVQTRYFGVNDMATSETFSSTEVVPVFYGGVPATPISTVTSEYESDLHSVEYNLRYRSQRFGGIRWITGMRYLDLEEQFDFDTTDGGAVRRGFFSNARNEMIGVQAGAEWTVWTNGRSRVFTSGKYAVLHNEVEGQGLAANPGGGSLIRNFDDRKASGLFDLEVGGTLSLTSWLGVRVAYQGLFGQDWAMAPDQSNAFSLFNDSGAVAYSDPQWHGLNLSAEFAW